MRILVTGATGLIGREIVKHYHLNNISINYLTTSQSKMVFNDNYKGFLWQPLKKEIDLKFLEDVELIIHLAGTSISKRWTASNKKAIMQSRIESTNLLLETLKNNTHSVKQVISASAIGIYPSSFTHYYDEKDTEISTSFLGQVVGQWEHSIKGFRDLNILVSVIRIGLVLSSKGGALPEIVTPIKYGVGAAFGSGKQWQSWIHIKDIASIFFFIYQNKLEGIYNGVSPNPKTNKMLTKLLANHMKKPLFLPNIPKILMEMILGQKHVLLFESQKVSSSKIQEKGFKFKFGKLQSALEDLL